MNTPDPLTEQLKASIDFENYKRMSQGSVDVLALEIVELKREIVRLRNNQDTKDAINKWNDLWDNGILGMTERECMNVLCFFHGQIKTRLAMGMTSPASFVEAMSKAIEHKSDIK